MSSLNFFVKVIDENEISEIKTPVVVVAEEHGIPQGIVLGPIVGDFDFGKTIFQEVETVQRLVNQTDIRKGTILKLNESTNHWISFIKPARDHQEQNSEFFKTSKGEIFLKTTKIVKARRLFLAWFSKELALEIGIPFLTPNNIKGNQTYVCNKCGEVFRFPNPLKSHIRFHCKMPGKGFALFRPFLDCETSTTPLQSPKTYRDYPFLGKAISTEPDFHVVKNSVPASNNFPNKTMETATLFHIHCEKINNFNPFPPQLYWHHQSDFFTKIQTPMAYYMGNNLTAKSRSRHDNWANSWKSIPSVKNPKMPLHPPSKTSSPVFPLPTEADGEPLDLIPKSLFSNKSSKGHLCIYCGKLYSRKYGLKIHLRTHTGYKPLKCKVCLRPFGDPSNLNKHIRLHAQGNTPYKCQFCGKILVRRRDLERHIRSRHETEIKQ